MNGNKRSNGGYPSNFPDLEEPCPICLLTKVTKVPTGPTFDVLKFIPRFMLKMDFSFFNIEIICGFTSTFVAMCSSTSHLFGFTPRIKRTLIDILNFIFSTLSNQDKKLPFIKDDKDGSLERSSEFMKTCHNMNIILQTTYGDKSSPNGKVKIPNKTISNITRAIILN